MSAGSGVLLGRDAEVADAVGTITGVSGGYVALVGAAGIGKSSVLHAVTDAASHAGLVVRTSTGAVSESDLPFVGLHDLIGGDASADLPEALQDALDGVLLRTRPGGPRVDPLALNLAVLRVVERLSADRRLLLVLDDLPWIDAATRTTLTFVLRRLPPERVSLLVAMRPEADGVEVAPTPVRSVRVGPLDRTTLTAAVELRTGLKLPHRLAGHLHRLSGGNPLLALELVRTSAVDEDSVSELAVPERYRTVLAPRLDGLSPDARRALLAASLLSRPSLEELADVASIDGLLDAEVAGVVHVRDGRVTFTHPLFAALCRDAASSSERRDMHERLAKTARDELERARHLGSATLLPDEDVAARLEGAAEVARGRAAIAAAAELALQAERLTPTGEPAHRAARACTSALLFFQTGDISTAASVVRRVLDDLEPGPIRAQCLATLAEVLGAGVEGAAALLQEALRQPGLSAEFEDELRYVCGMMLVNLGDLPGSGAAVAELEVRAEASGRADLARRCRAHIAFVDLATGTPAARSVAWQRMVEEAGSFELAYDHPDLYCAWEAMSREDNAGAIELMDGLMERARLAGNIEMWAAVAVHRSEAELRRGEIVTACDLRDEVRRILADGRHDEFWLSVCGLALAWRGRLDDARADARAALVMAKRDGDRLWVAYSLHTLGFVELSAGDADAASACYDEVAAVIRSNGWRHPSLVPWHGNAIEALIAVGRTADAAALTDELAAAAELYGLATSAALAARCRALLLEHAGDLDGALRELDESVRVCEPLGTPLELARTLLIRGIVQRRRRQKALARDDLGRARDLFAARGAVVWADRAERELERSAAVAAGAELTASERAVAELAASGSTNREIASSLYLSEKTVEAVLTRVYRKLAVRSRTQLGQHPELAGAKGHA